MIVNIPHPWEMHCHSQYSDGALSCSDLFSLAQERGVKQLALTDHDTAKGYRDSIENAWVPDGLDLIPATELSCIWRGRTVHIVGLGIDAYSDSWLATESDYVKRREVRFKRILTLLERAKFDIDEAQIRDIAGKATPARPHIAEYLVSTGQVKNIGVAYKRWLGQGKMGDVKQQWPELEEAVAQIVAAGGLAVLAHPHRYRLTWTKAREMLDDFCESGGRGIEVACIGMHPDFFRFLTQQAREREMYVGGGSDFHHPKTEWIKLGYYPAMPNDVHLVSDWLLAQKSEALGSMSAGNARQQ